MNKDLYEGRLIEREDFVGKSLSRQEYEDCEFRNCNFSQAILQDSEFMDCRFINCLFSQTNLRGTGLKGVEFWDSKLLGIDFEPCSDFLFSVKFTQCQLDFSSFRKKNMKGSVFTSTSLKQVLFEDTVLTGAVFGKCDLEGAIFLAANLEKADFRTASNFNIDPGQNRVRKARFSSQSLAGLLEKYELDIE